MTCPNMLFNEFMLDYIKCNDIFNIDDFQKILFSKYALMSKFSEEDKLLIVYHKYELPSKTLLEQESRSLIIDIANLKIISYTCPNPIENKDAQQFLLNNCELKLDIFKCYEGSILSLFNHEGRWYLSTRRCIDSKLSKWRETNFYDMFMDVLIKEGITFEDFTSKLNPSYGYYFVLIHHINKNIIDYSKQFGEDYKKLCLIFVRTKSDQVEVHDYKFDSYNNIFQAEKTTMENFVLENQNISIDIASEGIVIKTIKDNNIFLFKMQTNSYQFCKAIGKDSNIFKGYLHLYQNDNLKAYRETNKEHKNLDKIINPHNPLESFDTIGMVDCVFKVLTSELFELYKLLWKLNNGQQLNIELYNLLPKEFKHILYGLRGIYFKIKINRSKNIEQKLFGISDIYNHLKTIDVEYICALLRQRKLMFNWVSINKCDANLSIFRTISNQCDKINIKLIAIFTNKLFPNIMQTDIPIDISKNISSEKVKDIPLEITTELEDI